MRTAPLTRRGTPEHSERMKRERKASWQRVRNGEGFIYVASHRSKPDVVKLGFSLEPRGRCYELQLDLLVMIRGTHKQELAIHTALRTKGKRDEYYPRSILNHPAIPAELRSAA